MVVSQLQHFCDGVDDAVTPIAGNQIEKVEGVFVNRATFDRINDFALETVLECIRKMTLAGTSTALEQRGQPKLVTISGGSAKVFHDTSDSALRTTNLLKCLPRIYAHFLEHAQVGA